MQALRARVPLCMGGIPSVPRCYELLVCCCSILRCTRAVVRRPHVCAAVKPLPLLVLQQVTGRSHTEQALSAVEHHDAVLSNAHEQ